MKSEVELVSDVWRTLALSTPLGKFDLSDIESSYGWLVVDSDGERVAYVDSRELAEALVALFDRMRTKRRKK